MRMGLQIIGIEKALRLTTSFVLCFFLGQSVFAESGQEIFAQRCAACHTVGEGRRVGPDLAGVQDRRKLDWIKRFVRGPQELIQSGDEIAMALFKEFNQIPMPAQNLSDEQLAQVLLYIKNNSGAPEVKAAKAKDKKQPSSNVIREATEEDVVRGRSYFEGRLRLENNGPACNSCHHVKNDAVIGGGVLARELTSVFSRMGGSGVKSILGSPPFAVMNEAYAGKPLTENEIFTLVSFLKHADEERFYQQPRDYGVRLFLSGLVGVFLLMGFYLIVFRKRRRRSVNQDIYDRQIESE